MSVAEDNPKEPDAAQEAAKQDETQHDASEQGPGVQSFRRDTRPLGAQRLTQPLSSRRGMTWLAVVSVILFVLGVLGAGYLLRAYLSRSQTVVNLEPPASIEELIAQYPEIAGILQNSELDSVYKDFFVAWQAGGTDAALELARQRGILTAENELRMTLELDTTESAELAAQLEARGINVTAASGSTLDIAIPIELIEQAVESGDPGSLFKGITGLEHVLRIRLPRTSFRDSGATMPFFVESQGVPVIGADRWHAQGFSGAGIKVGILDMGFNDYKSLLGSELPDSVTARSFIYGREIDNAETNHGTACAEVIHDIAPQAELFFAAFETDTEQSQAVDWLVSQGVNIISQSAGSIYGPMDGSSSEARMVNRMVERGIFWVNSAGNSGTRHYRGVFTDDNGNGYHEFDPRDELMGFLAGGRVVLVLNWDDWENGDQDYDLFVLDEEQNEIVSSTNTQAGPGSDSAEILSYEFPDIGPYYIAFFAHNATRPVTFDFFAYDAEIEYVVPDYSITTPADATRAFAVGATFWENDALEDYSSRGPTTDGRLKPDISAPTVVDVAVRDRPFDGTSAAAPHVAGAAALIWEAYPHFSPDDMANYLRTSAKDLGASGPDNLYGYGRLWMGDPPESPVLEATPPAAPTPTVAPTEAAAVVAPTSTATPIFNPVTTPEPESNSSLLENFILLMACVSIPGFMGLGGLILFGVVWNQRRSRRSRQRVRPAARPAPRPGQIAPGGPPAGQPVNLPRSPDQGRAPSPGDARQGVTPLGPELKGARPQEAASSPAAQNLCPRCATPYRPQARFCNTCGFSLSAVEEPRHKVRYCNQCGQQLREGSKFCPKCGKRT